MVIIVEKISQRSPMLVSANLHNESRICMSQALSEKCSESCFVQRETKSTSVHTQHTHLHIAYVFGHPVQSKLC